MNTSVRSGTALWIALILACGAGSSLASPTNPDADVAPASPARDAEMQSRPNFSGRWSLNTKASDDPQEKVKEAMKAMKQAKGGGRGMGGGSGGQGRGGGKGSGQQGRGSSGGTGGRSGMPGEMAEFTISPESFNITHEDPMLLITYENDRQQRIFTDFRGASVSISNSAPQRVAVAGWEDSTLVVETTMNGGTRLTQRYQIDTETGQLMISAMANLAETQPVSFRLVYDRLEPGMDVMKQ